MVMSVFVRLSVCSVEITRISFTAFPAHVTRGCGSATVPSCRCSTYVLPVLWMTPRGITELNGRPERAVRVRDVDSGERRRVAVEKKQEAAGTDEATHHDLDAEYLTYV